MAEKEDLPMAEKKQSGCGCGCIASTPKDAKTRKPEAEESKK